MRDLTDYKSTFLLDTLFKTTNIFKKKTENHKPQKREKKHTRITSFSGFFPYTSSSQASFSGASSLYTVRDKALDWTPTWLKCTVSCADASPQTPSNSIMNAKSREGVAHTSKWLTQYRTMSRLRFRIANTIVRKMYTVFKPECTTLARYKGSSS